MHVAAMNRFQYTNEKCTWIKSLAYVQLSQEAELKILRIVESPKQPDAENKYRMNLMVFISYIFIFIFINKSVHSYQYLIK